MKFIVSSSALLKQLQQINGVIGSNNVLPILEDFLFEIDNNKLTVVATDLETVMKACETRRSAFNRNEKRFMLDLRNKIRKS